MRRTLFLGLSAALAVHGSAGAQQRPRPRQQGATIPAATTTAPTPPSDSAIIGLIRRTDGQNEALNRSFCGLTEATPGATFQVETGAVMRRGAYNASTQYWPYEVNAEGVCATSPGAEAMLGAEAHPFLATIQLRFSQNDFGDGVIQIVHAESHPPTPVLWMKFYLRRLVGRERDFYRTHRRFTSNARWLSFETGEGASTPVITASDAGWWAFMYHGAAADTICSIADGVTNPLTGSASTETACLPRVAAESRFGRSLPQTGAEREWPVGSLNALDSLGAIVPQAFRDRPSIGAKWATVGPSAFPLMVLRVPASPRAVWNDIEESFRVARSQNIERNREGFAIIGYKSQMLVVETHYLFSLLADSVDAPETILRVRIMVHTTGEPALRLVSRQLDRLEADIGHDFPGATRVDPSTLPASFRSSGKEIVNVNRNDGFIEAMQAALRSLVAAQDAHFASARRYETELARLQYVVPSGVTVRSISLLPSGWTATVTHVSAPGVECAVAVNGRNPLAPDAPERTPACRP